MIHARDLAQAIPRRIKKIRLELGLDEARLGALAGLPEERLRGIEAGSSLPSLEDLQRIASGLGVEFRELIGPHD